MPSRGIDPATYCRFSSMDGLCEVCCYRSRAGGYVTAVRKVRLTPHEPFPDPVEMSAGGLAWVKRISQINRICREADRAEIDLPGAGETFVDHSATDAADRLECLQALGYRVPQYAVDVLRAEAREALLPRAL